jgi:hypothetical protein
MPTQGLALYCCSRRKGLSRRQYTRGAHTNTGDCENGNSLRKANPTVLISIKDTSAVL